MHQVVCIKCRNTFQRSVRMFESISLTNHTAVGEMEWRATLKSYEKITHVYRYNYFAEILHRWINWSPQNLYRCPLPTRHNKLLSWTISINTFYSKTVHFNITCTYWVWSKLNLLSQRLTYFEKYKSIEDFWRYDKCNSSTDNAT